jgi:putative pyruvate formate lyase activating enzyme
MEDSTRRGFLRKWAGALAAGPVAALTGVVAGCRGRRAGNGGSEAPALEGVSDSSSFEPGYLRLHREGELASRGDALWAMMERCELCPRRCGAARLGGERGFCGAGSKAEVASHHPHFGEESVLVGRGGSGTVFMTHCSLRCAFCINWTISQGGEGEVASLEDLAAMMLDLERRGCHNINIVTPTHYSAHVVRALDLAAARGLRLPVVWNTCGWELLEVLRLLDGVVDIYLPDFKYWDPAAAARYSSGADSYPAVTRGAILEMHAQVGVARPGDDGLVRRGLLIRHLVMPNGVSGAREIFRWIAENLPKDTYVNVMSQYRPVHRAFDYPEIGRRLTQDEYEQALAWAREAGLTRIDAQGW